jgi:hypothetical protein
MFRSACDAAVPGGPFMLAHHYMGGQARHHLFIGVLVYFLALRKFRSLISLVFSSLTSRLTCACMPGVVSRRPCKLQNHIRQPTLREPACQPRLRSPH